MSNFLIDEGYFKYAHLPEHLQAASKPFCELAMQIDAEHVESPEKSTTLRKLLEAKDAAVRSFMYTAKS